MLNHKVQHEINVDKKREGLRQQQSSHLRNSMSMKFLRMVSIKLCEEIPHECYTESKKPNPKRKLIKKLSSC